ncbi:LemA family protein [Azohydromonas australica]|uniref:LemA family protein n=1 Tax=Azohydromonas australica TaxID=364039 RepID=UPI000414F9D1|nr:LemA family protein [Azohydromonas australica]
MVKIAVFMFALFLIATVAAAYAIALFNALVDAKHQVEQAWCGIDVLLRQRHDEVPRLIEMLKEHGGADGVLLEQASGLHGRTGHGVPDGKRLASEEALSRCIRSLLDFGAGHPQMQASEAYRELQQRIGGLEERIAQRSDHYNAAVRFNNSRMERFSSLFFKGLAGMARRPLFATEEHERTDMHVSMLPAQ